ncbi:MAG: ABC transporter ATP-binding protein [Oscillospiraceae bacterium]|nr:ABC transporter ATP-binding protein [Oscillospiraceae bacterium]
MAVELLKVERLCHDFGGHRAVEDVSFSLEEGEIFGLVGESGSGKTTLGRCIMGLYRPTSGQITFRGHPLTGGARKKSMADRAAGSASPIQMIFQDPMASLDPRMTVGESVEEGLILRSGRNRAENRRKVAKILETVGLQPDCAGRYPHEFSGGQRQRIGIARAVIMEPKLLIADEAVSALDVSVQAQVINLLLDLRERMQLSILFIAHDLAVVKYVCDRIAVMYLGRIVELAPAQALFEEPLHPYTQSLLSAIPVPDPRLERQRRRLAYDAPPPAPRQLRQVRPGHWVLCSEEEFAQLGRA